MANNNNSRTPGSNDNPSPTELDFSSFLNEAPQNEPTEESGFAQDIEATEKSLENDIRGLYEDVLSSSPSPDAPIIQPEVSPYAADATAPAEVSPEEPEVFYSPAPAEDDFNAVISGALGELDSLLDGLYGEPTAPKEPAKAAQMQDISSVSDGDITPPDSFGVVSPDKLDSLSASAPAEPVSAGDRNEDYFLGRVPATAPGQTNFSAFSASPKRELPSSQAPSVKAKDEKKPSAFFPSKGDSGGEIVRKIVLMISLVTIVVSSGILVNSYFIEPYRFSVQADKAVGDLLDEDASGNVHEDALSAVSAENPETVYPDGLLKKYYKLYAANNDLAGWINIPALQINLPLVQGNDNQYYLKRDVYGKRTKYGVPFFDYRNNLKTLDRNTVIYGHNMEYDDLIFGMLENYRTIDGYKSAPVIECNTIYGDYSWLVYAAFVTNGTKKDDNGYVFNYNFTELDNFTFLEYKEQVDMRKLYTTGVELASTDKILTLSTCCYDFSSARLVVIARLLRDGESVHVSTANVVANTNPRYPQAWYDAQNKSNPYADYEQWVAYADLAELSN